MSNLTLGIDLGTNSIGWAIRDITASDNQIIKKGVLIFDKGVGEEKGIEFPKVKKRTESRGKRRNYQAEKYRKWELLEFLIKQEMCPLNLEELNSWRKYTKKEGRKYPQSEAFINWLRFDFNGDGKPDFHLLGGDKHESYYIFRAKAVSEEEKDRKVFKNNPEILGRVFYQLVQRRGFKGRDEEEAKTMLKGSKDGITKGRDSIAEYIEQYKSLGGALYHYQKDKSSDAEKIRIRQRYNLRKDYENEIKLICKVQGLSNEYYSKLHKAIIWQRPLRTQKGLVGLCTYEKNKRRAPISHPLYEEYRTWVFINNLKIQEPKGWEHSEYLSEKIYPIFYKSGNDFSLSTILKQLKKDGATINSGYSSREKTKVLSAKLLKNFEDLFGETWKNILAWDEAFVREKQPKKKTTNRYSFEDVWHILSTYDSEEKLKDFALNKLNFSEEKAIKFSKIKLQQGYATLSLSAIKKIIPYLKKGFIYSKAVYMANIQKVLGTHEVSTGFIDHFASEIDEIYQEVSTKRKLNNVLNGLFKEELVSDGDYQLGENQDLDATDQSLIKQKLIDEFGEKTWEETSAKDQENYFSYIAKEYKSFLQNHFQAKKGAFIEQPRIHQHIFNYLQEHYQIPDENIKFLWHPSEQEKYPNASNYEKVQLKNKTLYINENEIDAFLKKHPNAELEGISLKLLESPEPISKGFKNPMALKTLHKLKHLLNYLLQTHQIDADTRIVIEIARELNNANYRIALERWQKQRERENTAFKKVIEEINKELGTTYNPEDKNLIRKIRLWEEQGRKCLYTGETINKSVLLNGEYFDIEHTIPASISFDNELKNLTLANKDFNANVKGKKYPTQLDNYNTEGLFNGKSIQPIIKNIESIFGKRMVEKKIVKKRGKKEEITIITWSKIADLEKQIDEYVKKTTYASTKEIKDAFIQKRHQLKFDLDYLKQKLHTFTVEEYKAKWRNSQLRDTQIMTKYAIPYLKTVFNRVEVQKGNVVNIFKEVYRVKLSSDKKDRSKHSHHAIDGAILTLIPKPVYRDEIIKKYQLEKDNRTGKTYHVQPIDWKDFTPSFIKNIENETLINNLNDHRTLTPTFKKVRKRGKIDYDENGNVKWAKGDAIRGQLHDESFYGAIKQPKRDDSGKIIFNENKKMQLEDEIKLVIRKPLAFAKDNNTPGFKKLDDIEKVIVDQALFQIIKKQVEDVGSLKDALEKGIYMLNKKGEKVNKIRHIRCEIKGLSYSVAVKPHKHQFISDKKYKQSTIAKGGNNIFCLFYKGEIKKKEERSISTIGIFDLAKLDIQDERDFFEIPYFNSVVKKNAEIPLYAVLKAGQKAIFYKESLEELTELSKEELSQRMYKMYQFENGKGGDKIKFKHHLVSGDNTEINKSLPENYKEAASYGSYEEQPLMRLSAANWNFAIEGKDFEMKLDGTITWKF